MTQDVEPYGGNRYVRVAYGVTRLFTDVNKIAPHRSKLSDGTLGDPSHAQHRSGHNPNTHGIVCAGDITQDPAGGADCGEITEAIRLSQDPRVLYVIFDRRIFDGPKGVQPFTWRPYDGASPHLDHAHVSLRQSAYYYDDVTPWEVAVTLSDADKHDIANLSSDMTVAKLLAHKEDAPAGSGGTGKWSMLKLWQATYNAIHPRPIP